MNARSQIFEFSLEDRQINEALASIFHTVLFHRSLGKFLFSNDSSYSVGTIGTQDIDCDFIDFTYVCCSSPSLDRQIKKEISSFSEQLRSPESTGAGQISLEFFQKKKNRWPFQTEFIPWEVWTIRIDICKLHNEDERQMYRESVGDMLTEKILYITEVINRHDLYVPKMPAQTELDLIFDTTYPDIQPYSFKFTTSASASTSSVKSTMHRLIKETLSL
jgi:autophagy-related protein 101